MEDPELPNQSVYDAAVYCSPGVKMNRRMAGMTSGRKAELSSAAKSRMSLHHKGGNGKGKSQGYIM